jgi:hypothetical protein
MKKKSTPERKGQNRDKVQNMMHEVRTKYERKKRHVSSLRLTGDRYRWVLWNFVNKSFATGISAVEIPIVQFIQKIRRFAEFPPDFRQEKRSSKSDLLMSNNRMNCEYSSNSLYQHFCKDNFLPHIYMHDHKA